MKTLTEAVKACGGVWPGHDESHDHLFTTGPGLNIQVYSSGDFKVAREDGYINSLCSLKLGRGGWSPLCTRPEFEAEAARLSGKPGWGNAPEGARILVQNGKTGRWRFGTYSSAICRDDGDPLWVGEGSGGWFDPGFPGTVLGDWRDTLERRPESEPVVSTDGDQILNYYMPLPGEECECWDGEEWHLGVSVGPYMNGWLCMLPTIERPFIGSNGDFRPLKSDRERWVEAADKLVSTVEAGPYVMLETLYDALKSGELPMPE